MSGATGFSNSYILVNELKDMNKKLNEMTKNLNYIHETLQRNNPKEIIKELDEIIEILKTNKDAGNMHSEL